MYSSTIGLTPAAAEHSGSSAAEVLKQTRQTFAGQILFVSSGSPVVLFICVVYFSYSSYFKLKRPNSVKTVSLPVCGSDPAHWFLLKEYKISFINYLLSVKQTHFKECR